MVYIERPSRAGEFHKGDFSISKAGCLARSVCAWALGLAVLGCGPASIEETGGGTVSPAAPPGPSTVISPMAETDAEDLADVALRLGGLAGADESVWAEHARAMDALWDRLDGRHLRPMRAWAEAELHPADPSAPLFYPFGGPDLASAHQFFPEAQTYYLVGLEPPGKIPELAGLEGEALAVELARVREGLGHLVDAGYFVTTQMERDFASAQRLDGFLPVLYLTLARLGYVPDLVRYVGLTEQGGVVAVDPASGVSASGVEIGFIAVGIEPAERRSLFYFAQDLSNEGLVSSPGFSRLLLSKPLNTYMKSAEYLPHMEGFESFNHLVLQGSKSLLQDDSGIPFRQIAPDQFTRRLFGVYTATLPSYRSWFQDDLRLAYTRQGAGALEFAIGYNSRISGSCLIWAERLRPAGAEE